MLKQLRQIEKEYQRFFTSNQNIQRCRCGLAKEVCFAMEHLFELDKMTTENIDINALKSEIADKLREWVNKSRQVLATMKNCTHDANDLSTIFENVILPNKENVAKTFDFVKKTSREN